MEVLGVAIATILLFVLYGGMVGVVFGFFGMGSFLVTPALIVMGYDSRVVVGSGLAFVFGTAVIGTLRHRDFGQVDYRLGVVLIAGTVLGIEIGKRAVLLLEAVGVASLVVASTYVVLLSAIGAFVVLESRGTPMGRRVPVPHWLNRPRERLWSLWPRMDLREGETVSAFVVFGVAVIAGVLSGFLGVGGGFLRMPALTYLFGMSLPVAVGTNIFAVMFSGAFGSFTWAQVGGVDLSVVVPLLVGSAMGARIGSALTRLVDDEEMKLHFGSLLIAAAVAVAARQTGEILGIGSLRTVSLAVLVAAATVVSGLVVYSGVTALRSRPSDRAARAD
jgi:hypothetical protein